MSLDEMEHVHDSGGLFEQHMVARPADDTVQWRAALLQLVNWGGFGGLTTVPLRGDTTMTSGASGVGKSTILDAYTALMMPSDTKFNGASNDAVAGRARGVGQRNLLSYLRGAVDVVDDPRTGRPVEKLLRGKGVDTWGAVAMTFVNDQGGRYTALRTYYVPRRAVRSGEVQMQLCTHDGSLSLETLELAVPERFHANTLKKLYPGIRVHRTYADFSAVLHARLGIGANGDGAKALRLLARIQSGNQVRSVDELYKEMVLERPSTYAAADRAIAHFDDLDAAHSAMRTEEQKRELLEPITTVHQRKVEATQRLGELDSYGVTLAGDTPLRSWLLRTHLRLIETAITTNRTARVATADELSAVVQAEGQLAGDLDDAQDAHRSAGGSTLQSLTLSLEQERVIREDRMTRRAELQERLLPLIDVSDAGAPDVESALMSTESFALLQLHATQWLAGWQRDQERIRRERDAALKSQFPLSERQAELRREQASLASRAGRVPARLHELRAEVAEASGLSEDELPFVAELIDVAPDQARWRTAIETVLGGSARTMLVPLEQLEDFSSAIDGLQLRGRLTFEGVDLDLSDPGPADRERVAGKLVFKDSPFAGWVRRHVDESPRNALCVESASDLGGADFRVTRAGQTRNGRRGAHGRNDMRSIIGFSNEEVIAEIETELARVAHDLDVIGAEVADLDRQSRALDLCKTSYDVVVTTRFDLLDVDASDQRIGDLDRRRQEILDSDNQLQALESQVEELKQRLESVQRQRFGLEHRQRELNDEHGSLVDDEDVVKDRLEKIDADASVVLSEEQAAALAGEFAEAASPADPNDLERFTDTSQRLAERLRAAVADAEVEIRRADDDLVQIFKTYKLHWESPNLGATPDSYPDYARILDEIRGKGLAERRAEWRRRLTEWSGQDLVPLVGAMSASVEEIEDRLDPINTILRRVEFGGVGDRLRIRLKRLAPAHVQLFMKDLRALSAGSTASVGEHDLEKRFADLSRFMIQLRAPGHGGDVTATTDRDRLLDVRRHVEISAERYDASTGELRATYRTLGEKSGGESQELVAFIVGSALRFRLGDEMRSRPRFAPVFLDEGFVKADSEFAGRAVHAWKGLGFQLIIGVPLDKVTGLEPHMDDLLAITKNSRTHQSWITPIRDAGRA